MSTLGAQTITRLELALTLLGAWRADVLLAGVEAPTGPTVLTVGDLELVGSVLRSGLDATGKPHAEVVGGAGWERELSSPLSYQSDVNVRLKTVLTDLAARAGEPVEQPPDVPLGRWFMVVASRPSATVRLRDVLSALYRAGYLPQWRVDPDGTTRFGARSGVAVTTRATVLRRNAAVSLRVLGIDSPADLLPGNTIDGETIDRLVVRETSGKLEAEAYTS